jgi:hypothetical protein
MIYNSAKSQALTYWKKGEIIKAHETALKNSIKPLLMKTFFVQGKYREALQVFATTHPSKDLSELAIEAHIHLKQYEEALSLAKQKRSQIVAYLEGFNRKWFREIADKTYTVPFAGDDQISSDHWPGINAVINGLPCLIRFDTGGTYIVTGIEGARKLGIPLKNKHTTMHGPSKVQGWLSVIDSMSFVDGPSFHNIPVTIIESIGEFIIFGTNILEQFLTTVHYPNKQFIFTPRDNAQLKQEHYKLISEKQTRLPFYMWSDHFMFGKGKFGDHDSLNLFFDSGLITLTEINGTLQQASFMASAETLSGWGLGKRFSENVFIPTNLPLEIADLTQLNTLIWHDRNLKKNWDFGGIHINGLVSHAWLKNYTWTVDFDRMEYTFGF